MRRMHSNTQRLILVLGGHATPLASLAERMRRLGYSVARAKTPLDALDLSQERGCRFAVALVETTLPVVNLERALSELRARAGEDDLVFIAAGNRPDAERREQLRRADVKLALWEPVGDHALRFQLNRALAGGRPDWLRGDLRIPTEMPVRIFSAGREKRATVYSLSRGGAFLETARPSPTGADLAIELPAPAGNIGVAARVLYTNVPGNLQSSKLPGGMGIRFTEISAATQRAIERTVSERAAFFMV
jgi:CheY-like chemotaxis protein